MWSTWRTAGALLVAAAVASCDAEPNARGTAVALVYGADDREEYFEVSEPRVRDAIAHSTVALLPADALDRAGRLQSADTLGDLDALCDGEVYADQPATALCTGTLVDWDLILTAGHCARALPPDRMLAVFGYYYRAPGELALDSGAAIELQEVVAKALDPPGQDTRLDYSWFRLKHAVEAPREPVAIRMRGAEPGERLVAIGSALSTPLKADGGGKVRDARASSHDYFVADTDTSHGSSGGPALDEDGALLGILARGGADLETTDEGCQQMLRMDDGAMAEEQFTYAARALEELCASDSYASSLCRSDCGDPCRALPPTTSVSNSGCSAGSGRHSTRLPWTGFWLLLAAALMTRRTSAGLDLITEARKGQIGRCAESGMDEVSDGELAGALNAAPAYARTPTHRRRRAWPNWIRPTTARVAEVARVRRAAVSLRPEP